MSRTVFFVHNPDRKPAFQIETRVLKTSKGLVAEKRTANRLAIDHLRKMTKSYETLRSIYGRKSMLELAPAHYINEATIEFDYIEGTSVERALLNSLLAGDNVMLMSLLGQFLGIIDTLPMTQVNPTRSKKYVSVFGYTYSETQPCSQIGLIDLNFDNFILHNDKWFLIDYEWMFDFPVSKAFLVQRALWWFIIRHQESFKFHASSIDMVLLADNIYVPEIIYENYSKYFQNIEDVQIAEYNFQTYVNKNPGKKNIVPISKSVERQGKPLLGIDRLVYQEEKVAEMKKRIDELNRLNLNLRREKQRITSSSSYKLSQKIVNLLSPITTRLR